MQKFVLRKERLNKPRLWPQTSRPPQSVFIFPRPQIAVSNHMYQIEAHFLPVNNLARFHSVALAASILKSWTRSLAAIHILRAFLKKYFAVLELLLARMPKVIRNNRGGRGGGGNRGRGRNGRTGRSELSQGDVENYTVEERRQHLLLRMREVG